MLSVSDDKTIRVIYIYNKLIGMEFKRIKIKKENRKCS